VTVLFESNRIKDVRRSDGTNLGPRSAEYGLTIASHEPPAAKKCTLKEGDLNDYVSIAEHLKSLLSALDDAGESLAAIKVAEAIDLLPVEEDGKTIRGANDD